MTSRLPLLSCLFFLTLSPALPADPAPVQPYRFLEVPADREPGALAALEEAGIGAAGWSNAVVEVSEFGGVEAVPLASLSQKLTDLDPRWDPWLRSLPPLFLPREGTARIWVEAPRWDEARRTLGAAVSGAGPGAELSPEAAPQTVTGWLLLSFSLFYMVLRLAAQLSEGLGRFAVREWLWVPLAAAVAAGGLALAAGSPSGGPAAAADPQVSWARHRWFQEAWPLGATWADWVPGKAWSYRSYERRDGRLVETSVSLAVPDGAWARAVFEGLDRRHAARIFGLPNP